MRKGFTLIELLAVITILGLIGLIAIPTVDRILKNNQEELYKIQIDNIKKGAKSWAAENAFKLPESNDESITLTLSQLKKNGHVDLNIKNPITNKLFPNDMLITITMKNNNLIYEVIEDSGSDIDDYNPNAPILILKGNSIEYVEINSTYIEKGVEARTSNGVTISNITSEIKKDNSIVSNINTSNKGKYTITYIANDNNITSKITRTVIVRDTTPPVLIVPSNTTIDTSVSTFSLMQGVNATDNSGVPVVMTIGSNLSLGIVGTYTITYIAEDGSGNKTVKKRVITIIEAEFSFEKNFEYTATFQTFTVPKTGKYRIQLWDASSYGFVDTNGKVYPHIGRGGYASGEINLVSGDILYVYIGQQGLLGAAYQKADETFNGGGAGSAYTAYTINGLRTYASTGSAVGSSYISGHTGCVAITSQVDQTPKSGCTTGTTDNSCSIHYSSKIFTNTLMIDGAVYS